MAEDQLIAEASKTPRYQGKHVVIAGGEIHILSTKSKTRRKRLLTSLVKKYPKLTPVITFVPKENALILLA